MTENLLKHETSPYLLQHRDNPVHWRPWGKAAFEEAKTTGKPILLSVGYAACHWCHVMAHESFEDPDVAAVMNRLYVNVKVDREERPDVDQIYMAALHALGEQGGWPLTMFLTPKGEPFWGGTYFPKTARFGRPGFVTVLEEIARIVRDEPEKVEANQSAIVAHLSARAETGSNLHPGVLEKAAEGLLGVMDPVNGGTKGAPKFPNASVFELLWRAYRRTGNTDMRDAVLLALRGISQGGIYDHLGGGFARYSVDERWLVPHFEKMLYDNAQLIPLLTSAWLETGDDLFRRRVAETIAWLEREMILDCGAFAASFDADSEGEEGRFYVWTRGEILTLLGEEDGAFFADLYDARPGGNWEGKVVLNRLNTPQTDDPETEERLAILRQRLFDHRTNRIPPARDDKVLADWNGLTISALARAATVFDEPVWLEKAISAYRFISESMMRDGRLGHSWCAGKLIYPGLATDHAAICDAALALYEATGEETYLADALARAENLEQHYADGEAGGYFLSADDADDLILRPKAPTDEATPNANAVAARALVKLWTLTGNDVYRQRADGILSIFAEDIAKNVFMTAALLNAFDFRLDPVSVVIVGGTPGEVSPMVSAVRRCDHPNVVPFVTESTDSLPPSHPAAGKMPVDGKETAYVCHADRCGPPVTDPKALLEAIHVKH